MMSDEDHHVARKIAYQIVLQHWSLEGFLLAHHVDNLSIIHILYCSDSVLHEVCTGVACLKGANNKKTMFCYWRPGLLILSESAPCLLWWQCDQPPPDTPRKTLFATWRRFTKTNIGRTTAAGSENSQVLQKTMEHRFSNPGARVRELPSPAKTNGKSILRPWRQGQRIPKSCKKQWKIDSPTLALGCLGIPWCMNV